DNAVQWFSSYMSSRTQFVQIRKEDGTKLTSTSKPITRGVPQGSVLGPLLFILYSADIIQCFKNCKYHVYADDVQLYLSFDVGDTPSAVSFINGDLQRIVS
ncbi:hypothetical protein F3G54_32510, partial [Pseudomonas aeruginosa]